jgi:hypothetical protein
MLAVYNVRCHKKLGNALESVVEDMTPTILLSPADRVASLNSLPQITVDAIQASQVSFLSSGRAGSSGRDSLSGSHSSFPI